MRGVIDHLDFDLEFRRFVRVLDLLFVSRNRTTGDLVALDYQGPDRGSVVAAIRRRPGQGADPSLTSVWPASESTA